MKTICRLLIALMIWMPHQVATAGMIGADQVGATSQQADRATLANKLQALGLDPSTAQHRVAAMSDEEVQSLAGQINVPAGAMSTGAEVLLILIIAAAVWWWYSQR